MVVAISWKRAQQGLIQRNHSHIDDENLPGLLDPALETVLVVYEVLKRLLEDLSEECTEAFCEPPVERDVTERSAEGIDVLLTELDDAWDRFEDDPVGVPYGANGDFLRMPL